MGTDGRQDSYSSSPWDPCVNIFFLISIGKTDFGFLWRLQMCIFLLAAVALGRVGVLMGKLGIPSLTGHSLRGDTHRPAVALPTSTEASRCVVNVSAIVLVWVNNERHEHGDIGSEWDNITPKARWRVNHGFPLNFKTARPPREITPALPQRIFAKWVNAIVCDKCWNRAILG